MTAAIRLRAAPEPEPASPDALALERLARGDLQALGELYERHHAAVYRFVSRVTSGAADVDDIVHNAFLAVPGAAKSFDGRASCRPWLLGIAARHVQRRGRSLARFGRLLASLRDDLSWRADPSGGPERAASSGEDRATLEAAVARLGEAKRVVLVLAEIEGLSCEEIAASLEIPVGTVWTRLHHARRELRKSLERRRGLAGRRPGEGGNP